MLEKIVYKGFSSTPQDDIEDGIIYGVVDGIDGVAGYEADNLDEVREAFRNAVDDYIDACREAGVSPEPTILVLA